MSENIKQGEEEVYGGNLTIGERHLASKGAKPGELSSLRLEEVRDYLQKFSLLQDPVDYTNSLDNLIVSFTDGKM